MRLFHASEEDEPEKKEVSELRSELWEKEMKLTDIRLEALSSAHQLDQLREAMNRMQVRAQKRGRNTRLSGKLRQEAALCHALRLQQNLRAALCSGSLVLFAGPPTYCSKTSLMKV